jgi:hypothetical protein
MKPQELLKYFGVLATTWVGGDLDLALERVPSGVIMGAVDAAQNSLSVTERVDLYRFFAHDSRTEVHSRLKESLTEQRQLSELRLLAEDRDPDVQEIVVSALRTRLQSAAPEGRANLATSFALALSPGPRVALAKALPGNIPGETDYLYVLAQDADPNVRLAAVEASGRLLRTPTRVEESRSTQLASVREVFETRLFDPEGSVRKQARRGYAEASAQLV